MLLREAGSPLADTFIPFKVIAADYGGSDPEALGEEFRIANKQFLKLYPLACSQRKEAIKKFKILVSTYLLVIKGQTPVDDLGAPRTYLTIDGLDLSSTKDLLNEEELALL